MHRSAVERLFKGHQRGSGDDVDYKVDGGAGGRIGDDDVNMLIGDKVDDDDVDNNENSPNVNFTFSAIS